MVASVLVGAGRITLSLDDSRYTPAAVRAVGASHQLNTAWRGGAAQAVQFTGAIGDVTRSMRSSLIATAAYAVGVNAVRLAIRSSIQGFLTYDEQLIAIAKTTGLSRDQVESLGRALERLVTTSSVVGRALPTDLRTLFEIAEVGGQAGLTGRETLREFSEQTALLVASSRNLDPERAAEAVARLIQNTSSNLLDLRGIVASVTRLGNEFLGGEAAILEQALNITRALSQFRPGADDVLAVSAVLEEAGSRAETSSTALLRTFIVLNQATAEFSRNPALLTEIATSAGRDVQELRDSLAAGDVFEGLRAITEALTNLRTVVDDPLQLSRSGLLRLLFGGERGAPVRLEQTLGVLTSALPRLRQAFQVVGEEFEDPLAAIEETANAAEAFQNRINASRENVRAFARDVGESLVPALVALGEQVNVLAPAFLALAGALTGRALVNTARRSTEQFAASQGVARAEIARTTATYEQATARQALAARRFNQIDRQLRAQQARRAVLVPRGAGPGGLPAAIPRLDERIARSTGERIDATERLARANRNLAATQIAANTAQVQGRRVGLGLTRAQTRLLRVTRSLRTVYAGLGGHLGLAIAAAIALTAVYRQATRASREQAEALEDIDRSLEAIQERNDARRFTEAGLLLRSLNEQVETRRAALQELEDSERRFSEAGRGVSAALYRQIDEARDSLLEFNRRRIAAIQEAQVSGATRDDVTARRVAATAELINTRISEAAREAREFSENLRDAHQAAIDRADLEERLVGLTVLERRVAELRAEDERSIADQRREADRELRDTQERLATARSIEREAAVQDAETGLSPEQNEARERNLQRATTQRQRIEEEIADLLIRQAAAYDQQIDSALILARSIREITAETIRAFSEADIVGARGRASESLAGILQQIETTRAEAEQDVLASLQSSSQQRLASLQREALNRITVERDQLHRQVELAERQADRPAATGQDLARLQESIAALNEFNRLTIEGQADLDEHLRRTADALGSLENPIHNLYRSVSNVGDALRESGARSLAAFGDELASVVEDGKVDFNSLANSIVADLIRILTQAIVVGNILRGIFGAFPGLAPPGFGAAQVTHEGGIAGGSGPRRPIGSLRAGEVHGILEVGEEVLTTRDPRHRRNFFGASPAAMASWVANLPRFHRGGVAGGGMDGGAPRIRLEVVNQTPIEPEFVDNGYRIDAEGFVLSVIMRDYRRNGPVRQLLGARR